jgi:hypothetical protein
VDAVWADVVRSVLSDKDKGNFNETLQKPHMLVEINGHNNVVVFYVTLPGPAISPLLELLRKYGVGSKFGRIILTSLEYMKPDLTNPLTQENLTLQMTRDIADDSKKSTKSVKPLQGIQHFQKARKTTEELYNEISNGANMNINTWLMLCGACTIAAGGLVTGVTVFIVAAMLVSPIMGPILGMTFGYRVGDFKLFQVGFINEIKMAFTAYAIGCFYGSVLGDVGKTYNWPNR